MSYARAVEGDTNSEVLDPAFHRRVQPPSQARQWRTTGIPQPPVASVNRPRIFSFPRAVSPAAASDLRGQSRIRVDATPAVQRQGNIISAQRSSAMQQQRKDRNRAVAAIHHQRKQGMHGLGDMRSARALAIAQAIAAHRIGPVGVKLGTVLRKSGMHGLGQLPVAFLRARLTPTAFLNAQRAFRGALGMHGLGQTVETLDLSLPTTGPYYISSSTGKPVDVVAQSEAAAQAAALKAPPSPAYAQQIANQLVKTGSASGTDATLFLNLPVAQQQQYLTAAKVNVTPAVAASSATAGITNWLNQSAVGGIPNAALVAAGGALILILATKKKR